MKTIHAIIAFAVGTLLLSGNGYADDKLYFKAPLSVQSRIAENPRYAVFVSPTQNLLKDRNTDEYTCYMNTNPLMPAFWCTCSGGDASQDCDNLFVDCEAIGGLYSCDSDFGGGDDNCHCEIISPN